MRQIALANSFVAALAGLDASSTKRTVAFLDKLVRQPDWASMHVEIVRDARDRAIRSLRITNDLRAIAHVEGDRLLLLYVDEHDNAYRWARDRCVKCHPTTGELQVFASPGAAEGRLAATRAVSEAERIARGGAPALNRPAGLFDAVTDTYLLSLGVPAEWLPTVRQVRSSEMFLVIAEDLPEPVAERLLRLATGELPAPPIADSTEPISVERDAHGTRAGRSADLATLSEPSWLCAINDSEELRTLLNDAGIEHGLGC